MAYNASERYLGRYGSRVRQDGVPVPGGRVGLRGIDTARGVASTGRELHAVHSSCFHPCVRTSERSITWRHGPRRSRTP
nr:MAG TPA: hypothetical protein [Caudoviricetes sp.]